MEFAEDGRIDNAEQPKFDEITKDLSEIVKAALELRCSKRHN